eukprot:TCALIF_12708-PA protein Name:"Protein of unknown function" AED:0.38 eAED:0.44 QI:0/0/0/0.5/1/1/2/0/258
MIDASDARMFESSCTYTNLTSPGSHSGRMTPPCYVPNSYTTLTPLQPLPPISTISSMQDKFQAYSPSMQNHLSNISLGSPFNAYEKHGMSPPLYHHSNPPQIGLPSGGSPSAMSPQGGFSQNGLHSKQEPLSPNSGAYYDPSQRPSPHDLSPHSIDHSPTGGVGGNHHYQQSTPLTSTNNPSLNGGLTSVSPHTISPVPHPSPEDGEKEEASKQASKQAEKEDMQRRMSFELVGSQNRTLYGRTDRRTTCIEPKETHP